MDIIGYIAAALTTISFLPQLIQVLRTKKTKDINLYMYIVFVVGVAIWVVYGFLSHSMPIIIANIFTFVFSGIILTFKIINTAKGKDKAEKKQDSEPSQKAE